MSYQKLFNNYFSTYGSQTGGAAVPAPIKTARYNKAIKTAGQGLAAPQQQLTQEQLNAFLQQRGMDNSPVLKPQTAMVRLTQAGIVAKSKEIGWRKTTERKGDKKFDSLSRSKLIASGLQVKPRQIKPANKNANNKAATAIQKGNLPPLKKGAVNALGQPGIGRGPDGNVYEGRLF